MKPNNQPCVMEGAIERANQLILKFLKAGPRSAREILAAVEGAKISARTIQRAAISLGVEKTKAGFNRGWSWRLPDDDDVTTKAPSEQYAPSVYSNVEVEGRDGKVEAPVENADSVKARKDSAPSRAQVIAARLRKLEAGRRKRAPIYAQDPRVIRWADFGISDPDLKEAYERAVFDLEGDKKQGPVTAGILDPYIGKLI